MSRHETKFYLKTIIIVLFLVIIFSYGIYEVWNYMTGPEITVSSPVNGIAVSESLITVAGQTKNIKEITLNDRPIVIDQAGNFTERILLSYGYNILVLRAYDRFGKQTEEKLQIVYK
jgi:hypothetical protein